MDGMLSQDEINALLQGMDLSDTADSGASPETPQDSSSAENTDNGYVKDVAPTVGDEEKLTDVEKDAIGEVANISMGSSATTLYSLVNRKVNITTPVVTLATWKTLLDSYEKPCVFIQIKYTQGLDGTNILVLKEHDVKVITDLMMGGDGTNTEGELGELHLSAISEAMNQMMGSAATSLSTLLQTVIDISPPESSLFDLTEVKDGKEISPFLGGTFVKISFRMQIDDLDSTIMQLYPIDFARKLVETFINTQMANIDEVTEKKPAQPENDTDTTAHIPAPGTDNQTQMNNTNLNGMNQMGNMGMNDMNQMNNMGMNDMNQMNNMGMNGMNQMGNMGMNGMNQMGNMGMNGMNQMGNMGMNGMNQMGNMGMNGMNQMGNMGMNSMNQMGMMGMPGQNVNVQPAQFQSFSNDNMGTTGQENIGLIKDVPLEVTVELGRTTKSISDILDFSPGTIIELDRIAGEPIDVLVNGKFVAKGEVVVIEESFGVRITEIIK